MCLEHEDHTTVASDRVCYVEIRLFIFHPARSEWSGKHYVDDFVITEADLEEISWVKFQMAASFDMKDLGDLHYFLRIEVIQTPEGILINQRHYVLNMLFKFSMTDYKAITIPLDKNIKLYLGSGRLAT